jgi:hypothetical protein
MKLRREVTQNLLGRRQALSLSFDRLRSLLR